ncbi:MAG: twin-arginine translocation pathway signal protein [Alphaproteobacteria bacterium]|nr:MAG: twin-arginine translocation pathway signal protein [Alphaproteobacteria bacterium]
MTSRRGFLRIVGSSAVVLAASGTWFAMSREPKEALAPWALAGEGYADPRLFAFSYGILAPNPHNRQPWMVDLIGDKEAVLYCDPERLLPETDPFNRQITVGLGCFLELTRLAALERGFDMKMVTFPEGAPESHLDGRPIAHLSFEEGGQERDPLFKEVLSRRSNKEPYDTARPVSPQTLSQLLTEAGLTLQASGTVDTAEVEALRQLAWEAFLIEMNTPRTLQESIDLMRFGKAQINANPDGIDLGGPMLEAMARTGLLTEETMADPQSTAFKTGNDMNGKLIASAMGHVWLITPDNSRLNQLEAGANWLRLNLKATELGLAIHPLSQALQEYPEMTELYEAIHQRFGATDGKTVQMFGRIGYGKEVAPKPRWKLETRLI